MRGLEKSFRNITRRSASDADDWDRKRSDSVAKGLVPSGNRDRDAPMTIRTNAGREQPMRPLFHPSLVNGRYGDPTVYVETLFERRGLLFDLGEIAALPPAKATTYRPDLHLPRAYRSLHRIRPSASSPRGARDVRASLWSVGPG